MTRRIAVVGAGISGLAAAWRLLQHHQAPEVVVFDANGHVGGVLRTEIDGDWIIEWGPESFLAMKPRGIGLARELGLEDRFQGTNTATRGSYLMRNGRLHRMPEGLTGLIPTGFAPMAKTRLVSPIGKLRMALDFVIPARKGRDDETLQSFIGRRLGLEVYDHLIEPLAAGIYSGSGAELSMQATYPQLLEAERDHGGLIRGVLAQRKARQARPVGHQQPMGFLSFRTGIHELPDALRTHIEAHGGAVRLRTPVTGVRKDTEGFLVETADGSDRFDGVVMAAPVHVQAALLEHLDADAAAAMRDIPQVSSAIIMLGYRETASDRAPQNHGYLIPRSEKRPLKAVTWMSSKWNHRAPAGHFLVRGFVGRAGDQEILDRSDDELVDVVRDEMRAQHGIIGEPVLTRVIRCDAASPQYTLGHLDRVARIEAGARRVPGLEIAGNMLRGVGIPDSIASGEAAADRLMASLEQETSDGIAV